jgi:SPP1 family holin
MKHFFKTFDSNDAKMLARVTIFLVAWLNQILLHNGKHMINIDNDTVYSIITQVATLASSLHVLWLNNNFTKKARSVGKNGD